MTASSPIAVESSLSSLSPSGFYHALLHPSTAIWHTRVAQLTRGQWYLLTATQSYVHVYSLRPTLTLLTRFPIYAPLLSIDTIHQDKIDYIVLIGLSGKVGIFRFENKQLLPVAEPVQLTKGFQGSRPAEAGSLCAIQSVKENPCGAVLTHQGILHFFQWTQDSWGAMAHAVAEVLHCVQMKWIHVPESNERQVNSHGKHAREETEDPGKNVLAMLHRDTNETMHVSCYKVVENENVVGHAPALFPSKAWQLKALETWHLECPAPASLLLPLPAPVGGLLIVCENCILYFCGQPHLTRRISIPPTLMVTATLVDPNGTRFLLADHLGYLHVLLIRLAEAPANGIESMQFETMGRASVASSLSYLDQAQVLIASAQGDSMIVQLRQERNSQGQWMDILDRWQSLAPAVDFLLNKASTPQQLLLCTGAYSDGALQSLAQGLQHECKYSVQLMTGVQHLFHVKDLLCISLTHDSTLFVRQVDEQLEECSSLQGLVTDQSTLLCCVLQDQIIQCTMKGVYVQGSNSPLLTPISLAAVDDVNLALTFNESLQVVRGKDLKVVYKFTADQPVSAVAIRGTALAFSTWDSQTVSVMNWQSQQILFQWTLNSPGVALIRCLEFTTFSHENYLAVGTGDGRLLLYSLKQNDSVPKYEWHLGKVPVTLHYLDSEQWLVQSDTCMILHHLLTSSKNSPRPLTLTPLALQRTHAMTCIAPQQLIWLQGQDQLLFIELAKQENVHVRTLPLGELPLRVTFHAPADQWILLTANDITTSNQTDEAATTPSSFIRIFDPSFSLMETFPLDTNEQGQCLALMNQELVVGTAFILPGEDRASQGRIWLLSYENGYWRILNQLSVQGGVAGLAVMQQESPLLVALIDCKVVLYNASLEVLSHFHCNVLPLYVDVFDQTILVGDLMRSVTVLQLQSQSNTLVTVARDWQTQWTTAVQCLNEKMFLVADQDENLVVYETSPHTNNSTNATLICKARVHLGDMINRFQTGSLAPACLQTASLSSHLYCTVNGAVGVLLGLSHEELQHLSALQIHLLPTCVDMLGTRLADVRKYENVVEREIFSKWLESSEQEQVNLCREAGIARDKVLAILMRLMRLH